MSMRWDGGQNNFSGRSPYGGPTPYGGQTGPSMPEISEPDLGRLEGAFNTLKSVFGNEIVQSLFSGLFDFGKAAMPSVLGHVLSGDERAQSQAMYDAQANLLNKQAEMLQGRYDQEKAPRADLLQALSNRMARESPSFLPDRPPTRRPYENVRRYDPRLTHQGSGDGYATRLSDALAYKWNPLGGQ